MEVFREMVVFRVSGTGRRGFLRSAGALIAAAAVPRPALAADPPAETLAALAYAYQRETGAHRNYVAFAEVAEKEGYRGIAYMFTAFAASEGIHGRNFKGMIARLGGQAEAAPTPIKRGTTKENLIAAVDDEIDSIDAMYPRTLERMKPEGNAEAMKLVNFAWSSERQHRDLIQKIRRYSPMLFEQVAKTIDEKTGVYFVCQTCGSTLTEVPASACPVCASPPDRYVKVPVPG